mgnify:FL=1
MRTQVEGFGGERERRLSDAEWKAHDAQRKHQLARPELHAFMRYGGPPPLRDAQRRPRPLGRKWAVDICGLGGGTRQAHERTGER